MAGSRGSDAWHWQQAALGRYDLLRTTLEADPLGNVAPATRSNPNKVAIYWVPEFRSHRMTIPISPSEPAVLTLPLRRFRGIDFTPRYTSVSARTGFSQVLSIAAGSGEAGSIYGIYLGISGLAPGINIGPHVWLNPDALTFALRLIGTLDSAGQAAPTLTIPAGIGGIAGLRVSYVALVGGPGVRASTPIQMDVLR